MDSLGPNVTQVHLKMLESLLHCSICYEYLQTAMMISQCSHNYCSLCIRRYFTYKRECPTCFLPASDTDLVKNRQLDNIVGQYKIVRDKLCSEPPGKVHEPSTVEGSECGNDRVSRCENSPTEVTASTSRTTGVTASTSRTTGVTASTSRTTGVTASTSRTTGVTALTSQSTNVQRDDGADAQRKADIDQTSVSPVLRTEGGVVAPSTPVQSNKNESLQHPSPSEAGSPPANRVLCPVCSVAIRERYMNHHLDQCLQREQKKESLRSFSPKRKPLPKLVYTLMNDKELKRRLQELKLSTLGDRQMLIKRHQEYTLLYNAECDAAQPKSIPEILKALEKNEANRTKHAKASKQTTLNFAKSSSAEDIEKMEKDYLQENKSRFQQLVAEAKKNMKRKCKEPQVIDITEEQETTDEQTPLDRQTTSHEQTPQETPLDRQTTSHEQTSQEMETADNRETTLEGETMARDGKEIVVLDGERHQTILSFVKSRDSNMNTSSESFPSLPALNVDELDDDVIECVVADIESSTCRISDAAIHVDQNVVQTESGGMGRTGNSNSSYNHGDASGNVESSQTSDSLLPCSQTCRMRASPENDLTADSLVDSDKESEASESLLQSSPVFMQTPTTSTSHNVDQHHLIRNNSIDVETSPVFHEAGRSRKLSSGSEVDIFASSPAADLPDDVIKSCSDVIGPCDDVTSPCDDAINSRDIDAKIQGARKQVYVEESSPLNSAAAVNSPDDFTCAWDFDSQPVVTRRSLRKRKITVSPSGEPARKRIGKKKGVDSNS